MLSAVYLYSNGDDGDAAAGAAVVVVTRSPVGVIGGRPASYRSISCFFLFLTSIVRHTRDISWIVVLLSSLSSRKPNCLSPITFVLLQPTKYAYDITVLSRVLGMQ